MKKKIFFPFIIIMSIGVLGLILIYSNIDSLNAKISGAPPYGEAETEVPSLTPWEALKKNWQRPDVPPKVGIQIGHLDNDKVPDELENLKKSGGAEAMGYKEVDINKSIAEKTAIILQNQGIEVDLLPTTVTPDYWADVFISIHADGSNSIYTSGFKFAPPWRDLTGNANTLVEVLEKTYQKETQMIKDPNITRNMRGYYAFSWWKYKHSIHPMTTAAIVETGFLTNWSDRQIIVNNPEVPAKALAEGIIEYLKLKELVKI